MLRNTNVEVPKSEGAFYLFVPVETDDNIGTSQLTSDEHLFYRAHLAEG
jgi:aspartate/methionine/tyrosine aminotransferase